MNDIDTFPQDYPDEPTAKLADNEFASEMSSLGLMTPEDAARLAEEKRLADLVDRLPVSKYGALAFDLALKTGTLNEICQGYNLTKRGLLELMKNRAMQDAIKEAKTQLAENGPHSNFIARSRFIAEDLLDDVFSMAKDTTTDAKLRFNIFQSMTRYARIDPDINKGKGDGPGGVSVTFNFAPGIKGMEHVMPTVNVSE